MCHPFIAPLMFSYQPSSLRLCTPLASGGHLFDHLQTMGCFDATQSMIYTAEIVSALQYLHDSHNIGSWLKPSSVLLDLSGMSLYVALTSLNHRPKAIIT